MNTEYIANSFKQELQITSIINFFRNEDAHDFIYQGEQHDFWEFIFVEKGEMIITAGENKYLLKSGETAFHRPGEFHAVATNSNTASSYIVCAFNSASTCMKYFEYKILSLNGIEKEMLYMALQQSKKVYAPLCEVKPNHYQMPALDNAPFGAEQMIQNYISIMLLNLYQRKEGKRAEQRMASYAKRAREQKLSSNVEKYLEQHIDELLKLEDIANQLGYCVSQIQKIFKAETGQSIMDYFIDLKISKAKQLIRQGNDNFTQIAAKLGYDNVNYFSRLFKQKTGITLTEYAQS